MNILVVHDCARRRQRISGCDRNQVSAHNHVKVHHRRYPTVGVLYF